MNVTLNHVASSEIAFSDAKRICLNIARVTKMPPKRKRTALQQVRHYLSGGGVLREDSDDELGLEDHPWEWLHSGDGKRIIGAQMGSFQCHIGDAVLLKAPAGNEAWVAIIYDLSEGEVEDDEGETAMEKKATMLWFSSEAEIRSKKKRTDFLDNELYMTANTDDNALSTINGKAKVMSPEMFRGLYPDGKVPRKSKDFGKIFVCRRGVNPRTATYTDEFKWEDVYHGEEDFDSLVDLVESQTVKTRKRKAATTKVERDLDGFVLEDDEFADDDPSTPRKRRKLTSSASTPSKANKLTPRKLTTPTHRRIVTKKPLEFTPLGTRVLDTSQTQSSPYQLARSTLHVSAVPYALPCRETEFEMVHGHLEAAIVAGTGACIYISGTPGTGKTATVREVVASLQAAVQEETMDDFVFVEINGMKVTDPHQSYSLLWEALKGSRVSPSHALELLEREFSTPSPRRVPCVVLMDELDQLVTRNQGVMYNFFNWPQLRHSRLIVLAVANTMDLPERTLSNKISSRLGLTRITFPGYTHTQLMMIIQSRLEGVGQVIVESDAVQFASRKVAAVSGDARRALDICRRAVELAEAESQQIEKENIQPDTPSKTPGRQMVTGPAQKQGIVTINTIKRAISEATSTPLAAYLRSLPLASKLFLAAVLARLRRTGIGEATLADVVEEARKLGLMSQLKPVEEILLAPDESYVTHDERLGDGTPLKRGRPTTKKELERAARVLGMGSAAVELADAGILGLEHRHGDRVGRVRLGVSEEDVRVALREHEECRGLGFGG